MKKLLFILLSVFFISNNSAQQLIMTDPDVTSTSTGTINEAMRTAAGIVQGGKDITALGTLKIPIVFVKFADDDATTTNWPNANVLPGWASNFVDANIPANNIYQNNNFSKFYDLSSGGNGNGTLGEFQVIGDVYFVTLNKNKSYYEVYGRGDAQVSRDVIDTLDNLVGVFNVDFSEYDNWEFKVGGIPYTHSNNSDGVLDFMLIYWKGSSISLPSNVGGVAGLGFSGTITKDGIDIISSNGVLGFKAQDYGNEHTIWVSAHEIGHHQFGMIGGNNGSHFNGRADNYGNIQRFGLMTRGDGHQFSAYERYRLGWLDPIVVSSNTNNIVLNETHKSSSNNAILIPVKYNTAGDLEEYFLLENYHSTNAYAEANPFLVQSLLGHTISKGIIAYHVSAENFNWPTLSQVDIESAEGLFAWEVIQGASTPSNRLDDLIAPRTVNVRNGFDERDTITATAGTITYRDYYALTPETTTILEEKEKRRYDSNDYHGDQEDLFSVDYNKIFTKWSNPSSIKDDGLDSNVGFDIVSYNSSTHAYTLNVAVNSAGIQEFAPSKPQNLTIKAPDGKPRISWNANTEPDISSYTIYRNINNGGWTSIGTTANSFYVDNTINPATPATIQYKIKAVDTQSKESVFTESGSITVNVINGATYTQNQTLTGINYFTANATVNAGVTLTVQEGTGLYFGSGSSLIVNGTLNIQGTSTSKVLLDFISQAYSPFNCITANSGSTVNIDYVEIKNSTVGIMSTDATIHIDHSNLHDILIPVYVVNTTTDEAGNSYFKNSYFNTSYEGFWLSYSSALIENNKITNSSDIAVRLRNYSYPSVISNTITNCPEGTTAAVGCSPSYQYNRLINVGYGFDARFTSWVLAQAGWNTIQANTYNAYALYTSYIPATYNYWGENPPNASKFYTDGTGSIDYSSWLTYDPGFGSSLLKVGAQPDLLAASTEMTSGNYNEAEKLFKKVIKEKFNETEAKFALIGLSACYSKSKKDGFKKYLEEELKPKLKDAKSDLNRMYLELSSNCLVQEGSYVDAFNNLQVVLDNYNLDSEYKKEISIRQAVISLINKNNEEKALSIFEKIKKEYPDKTTKLDVDALLTMYNSGGFALSKDVINKNSYKEGNNKEETKPTEFGLEDNYPNPFNPATKIIFTLKERSIISLKVFDALGKEVANLADGYYAAGRHEATFDGSNIASGIYFYRLITPTATITKKMVLTK